MSWYLTGIVSARTIGNQNRRLLLLTMADKANDDGSGIYASIKTLAEDSEMSVSTVRRLIKDFLDEGVLIHVGERKCVNGYTNEYSLVEGAIDKLPLLPSRQRLKERKANKDPFHADTPVTVKGVESGADPCHRDTPPLSPGQGTPVTVTPKPILEPIQEPESPPPPKGGRAARAARISEGWAPSEQTRRYAADLGFGPWEIDAAASEFRDYWLSAAGKNAAKLNWDLTFKSRLRDLAADPRQRNKLKLVHPALQTGATLQPSPEVWKKRLSHYFDHGGNWNLKDWGPKPGQDGYRGPKFSAHGA